MSPIPPKAREEERGAAMVGALEAAAHGSAAPAALHR